MSADLAEILGWYAILLVVVIVGEGLQFARRQFLRGLGWMMVMLTLFMAVSCTIAWRTFVSWPILVILDLVLIATVMALRQWRRRLRHDESARS